MDIRFFDFNDKEEFDPVYKEIRPDDFGYDLFDEPPAFAAFIDDKPVALATFIFIPGDTEAELTLFVLPEYRRMGVATALVNNIKDFLRGQRDSSMLPLNSTIVFTLPKELSGSSFAKHKAYSELLLVAKPETRGQFSVSLKRDRKPSPCLYLKTGGGASLCLPIIHENENPFVCRVMHNDREIAHVSVNRDGNTACLYGLYVSPDFRRKGIGQALIEYAISFPISEGIPVILNVCDTNTPALNLYKKIGFTEAESCTFYKLI